MCVVRMHVVNPRAMKRGSSRPNRMPFSNSHVAMIDGPVEETGLLNCEKNIAMSKELNI